MNTAVVGIKAASEKYSETFKTLRPAGLVSLIPDPENAYDRFAVRVVYFHEDKPIELGFLRGAKQDGVYVGSELQKTVIENEITTAEVISYAYFDKGTFNEDHKGVLQSVKIEIETETDTANGNTYGIRYQRVTSFISYFDAYGGGDGLIKWACDRIGEAEHHTLAPEELYPAYKRALNQTADQGTLMHSAIQFHLEGKSEFTTKREELSIPEMYMAEGQDSIVLPVKAYLPKGWAAFEKKYDLDTCYMEKRFFDNKLCVTGQPDWVGYLDGVLTVIDWKSSKKPSIKHAGQVAIYATNAHWDEDTAQQAMIVAFGSENKQGFATTKLNKEKIDNYYQGFCHVRTAMDYMGIWIPENKYWQG